MTLDSASRRDFLSLMSLAGVPVFAAAALRGWEGLHDRQETEFDQATLDKLRSHRAEIVLIGNSMIFQRLDTRYLDTRIAPLRSMMMAKGGWRSLAWLLCLQNLASACLPPTKLAVLVFRDYDFGNPNLNIERRYLTEIRSMMRPGDESLLQMARGPDGGADWRARIEDMLVPDRTVNRVRSKLNELAFDCASPWGDEDAVRAHTDQVFDLNHLRPEIMDAGGMEADSVGGNNVKFSSDPDENYLSRFVEAARAKNIQLVFYRVKRRPGADKIVPQTASLRIYMDAFKAWAEGQGCTVIDETDDPAITLDMFRDGDHLHEAVRSAYTDLFINRIRHCLPAPFTKDDIRAARATARSGSNQQ